MFCSDDCRSWPREEKINNHECWGKHAHIPDNDYWGMSLFHVVWTNFVCNYSYVVHTEYFFFIYWTLRMSNNLPERVQILIHAENRFICCQIFSDLLLKSALERIFNVMQLILVKIKWHIKCKYLIQKFHYICLSYYFIYVFNKNNFFKVAQLCEISKPRFRSILGRRHLSLMLLLKIIIFIGSQWGVW